MWMMWWLRLPWKPMTIVLALPVGRKNGAAARVAAGI